MELYTAFIIGLAGSLHCIGMCGPITFMLPVRSDTSFRFFIGRLLYNSGRVATYAIMGIIAGFIGNKLMLYGLQQGLSVMLGVSILFFVFIPSSVRIKILALTQYGRLINGIKNIISSLLGRQSNGALFLFGMSNGFLPCGLVYAALGTAAVSGSSISGMAAMMLFGAGTLPVMLVVSLSGKWISEKVRTKAVKLVPVFAVILAVIFILRGLNLGIPLISPKMSHTAEQVYHHCSE